MLGKSRGPCDHRPIAAAARLALVVAAALALAVAPADAADPRVTPRPVRVVEGHAGTTTVRVPLLLGRRAPSGARVRFRTRAGSAGAADFAARSGTVRFRRGRRRAVIVLRVRGDRLDEPDERFAVRLSKARRVRLGRTRAATVTIVDDDGPVADPGPPVATVTDVSATEPGAPGATAPHGLTLTLSRPATTEVRVDYELAGGGTTTAADVDLQRGTATFAPGQTQRTLPGVLRGDALDELDETASLLLSNPVGVQLNATRATLTILDDPGDPPPAASIADATVAETAGRVTLPVSLSAPSGRPVSIAYATHDGTADGADHGSAAGTLTFEPGQTEAAIDVPVTDDPRDEDVQSFTVSLAQPAGATLADADAAVAIEDDDAPPTVSIDDVSLLEADATAGFRVTLSAASEKTISARASTVTNTAAGAASCGPGADYVSLTSVLVTFPPGALERPLGVMVCEDTAGETHESTNVQLTDLVNATAGDVSGLLTILDEDP